MGVNGGAVCAVCFFVFFLGLQAAFVAEYSGDLWCHAGWGAEKIPAASGVLDSRFTGGRRNDVGNDISKHGCLAYMHDLGGGNSKIF